MQHQNSLEPAYDYSYEHQQQQQQQQQYQYQQEYQQFQYDQQQFVYGDYQPQLHDYITQIQPEGTTNSAEYDQGSYYVPEDAQYQQQYPQDYHHQQQQQYPQDHHQQQQLPYEEVLESVDIPQVETGAATVDKESGQVFIQETEELLASSIAQFRSIVGENVPLTYCLQHLRHKKFNVDLAVEVYRGNLAFRAEKGFPRQFRFADVAEQYRSGVYTACGRDLKQRQIVYGRPRLLDVSQWPKVLEMVWCLVEGFLRDETTQKHGVILILDGRGAGYQNFSRDLIRNVSRSMQNALPARVGGLMICYPPYFFRWIWGFVSFFMRPKVKKRVRMVGSDLEQFKQIATPENLPVELGGTGDYTSPEARERYIQYRAMLDDWPIE